MACQGSSTSTPARSDRIADVILHRPLVGDRAGGAMARGLFAPEAQDDVWGKDTSIQLSTSLAPTGTVERADRGFRLRGRWSFSSGCDFCHWAVLGGIVPPLEKDAPPDARTFLVPRSDYVIDD